MPDAPGLIDTVVQRQLKHRRRGCLLTKQEQGDSAGMLGIQGEVIGGLIGDPGGSQGEGAALDSEPALFALVFRHGGKAQVQTGRGQCLP